VSKLNTQACQETVLEVFTIDWGPWQKSVWFWHLSSKSWHSAHCGI